jgi:hypothetical protein
MIIEEYLPDNLVRHYTDDETKMLRQIETGHIYEDAIDVVPCRYTYEEVDKPQEETMEE